MSSGVSTTGSLAAALPLPESRAPRNADSVRVGVIGYGYWGPNIVRNLSALDRCEVVSVCDKDVKALKRAHKAYPAIHPSTDFNEVLASPDIDAVAIVTPVWTHFELSKKALENGKHVFVEKPFTSTSAQAVQLIELASQKNLRIMVDHTFVFSGAVRKIRELVDNGTLGQLYYFDSTRVNLGLFQHDVSVLWDLAPHDLSPSWITSFANSRKPSSQREGITSINWQIWPSLPCISPVMSPPTSTSTGCLRSRSARR